MGDGCGLDQEVWVGYGGGLLLGGGVGEWVGMCVAGWGCELG